MLRRLGFCVACCGLVAAAWGQPAPPTGLVSRSGDRSVVLHWDAGPPTEVAGYRVYRATDPSGPFEEPIPAPFRSPHFVDFSVANGQAYVYRVTAVTAAGDESSPTEVVPAAPDVLGDEAFIELVQQTAFDYFWYEANPANGLVRDRSTSGSRSSIAAVGFGLSALTVGIDRGWISRAAGRGRVLATLEFFWNSPHGPEPDATGYRGFFYHFLDMETGRRAGTTELSTIDTALLFGGILHVREYFDGTDADEARIRTLADSLYERVEWDWMQIRGARIAHGWRPESGFIAYDYGGYNETMILYLLALGSPTHPVGPNAWAAYVNTYKWQTYYGYTFVVFPPLFGHQYTHAWYDFRGIADPFMRARGLDYFENSRRATLAQRAYAIANPGGYVGYGANLWGFTASDGPAGYRARGAPPAQNDDGTLTPTAPGGSFPFTPGESLAVLRRMYDGYRTRIWWYYGFRDAFNPTVNWFSDVHLGIDQGPIVLMIENYRSGRVWEVFMRHEAVQRGLERAGFLPFATAAERPPVAPSSFGLQHTPNPVANAATIRYTLAAPEHVTLQVYDLLGRVVATLVDAPQGVGPHAVAFDAGSRPAGVYLYRLRTGNAHATGTMVVE